MIAGDLVDAIDQVSSSGRCVGRPARLALLDQLPVDVVVAPVEISLVVSGMLLLVTGADVSREVNGRIAELPKRRGDLRALFLEPRDPAMMAMAGRPGRGRILARWLAATGYCRPGARLRQTLMALAGGRVMGEHQSPGDASLLCMRGRVRVRVDDAEVELGAAGDLIAVPPQRHDVAALEPSVLLLTVALH
jgi:quercetin dioxygenase-like cupin family protein